MMAHLFPCVQSALAAGQETMGEGRADAAAVEVDDVFALTQWEDDALIKSIRTLCVDKTGCPQKFEGVTFRCEMTTQIPAGRIAYTQFSNQGRMVNSALPEIAEGLRILIQLVLIETGRLFEHCDCIFFSSVRWIGISNAFVEGQLMRELEEANQIAALPAAVAVEDTLVCVDVERGPALLMQRTETHILPTAGRPANPVLLPQVLQQGHSPSACLDILAHAFFPPSEPQSGTTPLRFPGKDGGRADFFYTRMGQRTSRAEMIQDNGAAF